MSKDEQAIEAEIQAKGLNAPRLSPEKIDAVITGEDYHVFPGTTLTVCCLKLRNGFTVTGESAAASPENFDVELGKKIARSNARDKIWALEAQVRPLPEPVPAYSCGDRLRPCKRCGADAWSDGEDDYGSLGDGGSYERFKCRHCGNVIYVALPD